MTRNTVLLRDQFNFAPLLNDFIGFDSLFNRMEDSLLRQSSDTFPPYDIYAQDVINTTDEKNHFTERHIFIEFALAGVRKDRLQVEFSPENILTIKTKDTEPIELPDKKYIRKGIAERKFTIQKTIDKDLELISCKMNDGMLLIEFRKKNETLAQTQIIEIE